MAELPGGPFDPSQHKDMQDFSPVPPGKYIVKIASSELKNTTTGGQMMVLNFDIAAGPYTGKGFVTRLNLWNQNPKAVAIAGEELGTISRAAGLTQVSNSEQLHGIPMVADLKLVPGDGQYGPKNEATFYGSVQGVTAPPVNPEPDEHTLSIMAGTTTTGASAPAGGSAPPPPPAGATAGTAPPAAPPAPDAAPAPETPAAEAPPAPATPPPAPAPAVPEPGPGSGPADAPPW